MRSATRLSWHSSMAIRILLPTRSLSTIRSTRGGHDPEAVKKISALTASSCRRSRTARRTKRGCGSRKCKWVRFASSRHARQISSAGCSPPRQPPPARRRSLRSFAGVQWLPRRRDALRDEMEQGVKGSTGGRHHEGELSSASPSSSARFNPSLCRRRRTSARPRFAVELVDSLARVYKLEADRDNGYGVHASAALWLEGRWGLQTTRPSCSSAACSTRATRPKSRGGRQRLRVGSGVVGRQTGWMSS